MSEQCPLESWRVVWRTAAPLLSARGLRALLWALEHDDCRLLQGNTTSPPPMQCTADWPCDGACLLAYPAVADLGGFGAAKVAEVEMAFAWTCAEIDTLLGEPAGCRWLLNYFDETDRATVRRELIPEVEMALLKLDEG